jgi:general secretion pathway protein M
MKEWWHNLTLRERQLVIACGVFCSIAFLYWGIWAPIQSGFDLTRKQVAGLEQQLRWMRQQAPLVAQLKQTGTPATNDDITTILNTSSRANHVTLKRIQPQGKTVQIELDPIAFGTLLNWLNILSQQQRIAVRTIELQRHPDEPGQVIVKHLELEQPHD